MELTIYELVFRLSGAAFAIPFFLWLFFEIQEVPHKKTFATLWALPYIAAICTRDIIPNELNLLAALIIYIVLPLLFGTGKVSKRLLKIAVIDTIFFVQDALACALYMIIFNESPVNQLANWTGTIRLIAYFTLCFIVFLVPAALAVRALFKQRAFSSSAYAPAIMLMAFQIVFTLFAICLKPEAFTTAETAIPLAVCLLVNVLLDIVLLAIVNEFQRAEERASKQKRMNDAIALVQGSLDDMESTSLQLHRIRHDIANQIQIIPVLLKNGERETAAKHLDELSESITSAIPENLSSRVDASLAAISMWSDSLSSESHDKAGSANTQPDSNYAFIAFIRTLRTNQKTFNATCAVLYLAAIADALVATHIISAEALVIAAVGIMSTCVCILLHVGLMRSFENTRRTLDERSISALEENEFRARQAIKGQAYANAKLREKLLETVQHARELLEGDAEEDDIHKQLAFGIKQIDSAFTKQTGNAVLDATLEAKRQQLGLQNIEIEVSGGISKHPLINNSELAAIAFNMIDNATNGIARLRKENGSRHLTGNSSGGTNERPERIWVTLRNFSGELIIETKNHCAGLPNGTVKPNTVHKYEGHTLEHGWGMEIIQLIAERNNGVALFEVNDGMFESTVMLPCK